MEKPLILGVESVSKSFGPVSALRDVSMQMRMGEITGLVGDNGAGKSTLVKVISGVLRPDFGTITFDGAAVTFSAPAMARARGIETVYQDLALAGNMTVWANVYLGREIIKGPKFLQILDKHAMIAETGRMLSRFTKTAPLIDAPVEALSGGQRQIIAIARAAAWGSKLIIMDEPTAALGVAETRAVEEVVLGLRGRGFSVLIVSHNLDQVFRVTDRVWVMRRGTMIGERSTKDTSPDEVVGLITGAIAAPSGEQRP